MLKALLLPLAVISIAVAGALLLGDPKPIAPMAGINHIGLTLDPAALQAVVAAANLE